MQEPLPFSSRNSQFWFTPHCALEVQGFVQYPPGQPLSASVMHSPPGHWLLMVQGCPTPKVSGISHTLFWQFWPFGHCPHETFSHPLKSVPQVKP